MPTSAIEYDVQQTVLVDWLQNEFGDRINEKGVVVWSVSAVGAGHTSWWSVDAPRDILPNEQHELKLRSMQGTGTPWRRRFGENRVRTV
ncbi:hypothetical protein QBC38DRAFT_491187 [Podospora fimiseda]|uniref:Uncharacterized protein n=1 Tax=Podospora fimiseda TaxID=252190 RepID=A0AAN6YMJ5_9PEZI|nr:hypothetical protein QBC38DRAFT_491187 [Podospora fimiseda]